MASSYFGLYDSLQLPTNNSTANNPTGTAESMIVVTFPTKYRHLPANSPDYATPAQLDNSDTPAVDLDFRGLDEGFSENVGNVNSGRADVLNDNVISATSRNSEDFDSGAANAHYDYDYGYRQAVYDMLQGFNSAAGVAYPNHYSPTTPSAGGSTTSFIFGTRNAVQCDGTKDVLYTFTSYDAQERSTVAANNFSTSVFSGDIGDGTTTPVQGLPNEVNLVTDANNDLWFSTKGWYNIMFNNTANNLCGSSNVPAIVMTVTTDRTGHSRVVPAIRD
jgi:hypothetical protein